MIFKRRVDTEGFGSFEYAVVPCRTLCCGRIFCTEHLADVRLAYVLAVDIF